MDDFGGKLRQARERRGVSLRQVSTSTKIAAAALEALERNDISRLPGGIFSRAFVRAYAIEVGLDPDATVREFLDLFKQDQPPTAAAIAAAVPEEERRFEERQRRAKRLVVAGVAIVLILIPALYFTLRGRLRVGAPLVAVKLDVHPVSNCWVSMTVDGRRVLDRMMASGEHEGHTIQREAVIEIGDAGAFAFSLDGREGRRLGESGQAKTLRLTPATAGEYVLGR